MNAKQLKQEIKTRLTGITPFVTTDKVLPHDMQSLPAIAIYVPSSSGESVDNADPTFIKTHDVVISVIVSQSSNYSETLDDLIEQIKSTLFTDKSFINLFIDISGYSVDWSFSAEGETPTVSADITINLKELETYTAI